MRIDCVIGQEPSPLAARLAQLTFTRIAESVKLAPANRIAAA